MTYPTFGQYREHRETIDLAWQIDQLCETAARAGADFDAFWDHCAAPVLERWRSFDDPSAMLREMGDILPPLDQMTVAGGQQGSPMDPDNAKSADPREQQRQKRLQAAQQQAAQMAGSLKSRFEMTMKDFFDRAIDDAKNSNNPQLWRMASMFKDRVIKTTQPVVDQFVKNLKVKFSQGQPDWRKDYDAHPTAPQGGANNPMMARQAAAAGTPAQQAGAASPPAQLPQGSALGMVNPGDTGMEQPPRRPSQFGQSALGMVNPGDTGMEQPPRRTTMASPPLANDPNQRVFPGAVSIPRRR